MTGFVIDDEGDVGGLLSWPAIVTALSPSIKPVDRDPTRYSACFLARSFTSVADRICAEISRKFNSPPVGSNLTFQDTLEANL